ncbi:MAG TPA: chemotaxis protein CheD [Noviherbaspirillum sp.]|nr:chemotaxis protein CheD [Noviherbaspirillum sp.]
MSNKNALIDIFLQPGEYFVGDADYRIRTLLGSCVSITLWHPVRRIGAMSHFLLARRPSRQGFALDARYGEEAMCLMLRELDRAHVAAPECQGKIFGGGDMFPGQVRSGGTHVGKKNGEMARELLRAHGIPILSESLFGVGHRQIIFEVATGHVWSRQVKPADNNQ